MRKLCGAKTRAGGKCKGLAMTNGRCRMHGGSTPTGFALPQTTHGRYSKSIPARIAGRFDEARNDPELLSTRDDIALLDARLGELLGRVDQGESGKAWTNARKAYDDLRYSMTKKDAGGIQGALTDLDRLIGQGLSDYAAWGEIHAILGQRTRLAESERKRLVEMSAMVSSEQALTLVGAVLASVKAHVTDRAVLVAIQNDMSRLMDAGEK